MTCKATGGDPKPEIRWKVGDDVIDYPKTIHNKNHVHSTLILGDLQIQDSGKTIVCEARNNDLFQPPTASARIEIILAPVQVQVSRTVSSFQVGTRYNLTCQVLGSHPPPTTSLWVDGDRLTNVFEHESTDGKIFTIIAEFTPKIGHDGAFISCRAKNKYLPQEALEDQWKISVVYKPNALINIKYPEVQKHDERNISISMDQKVILACEAVANPTPFSYSWRFESATGSKVLATGSSTLVLDNLSQDKAGAYYCLAGNW